MLERAFRGSRRYWTFLLFLLILSLIGLLFYLRQLDRGLGITGMGRDISWGLYIANFTFLVGVAASAVMVVLPYYIHRVEVFGGIKVFAEFLAASSILMCLLFVLVDLGQPKRLFNMLLYPSFSSVLFWDVVVLSGYFVINMLSGWFTLDYEEKEEGPPSWLKALLYISIPWAISIHTVTAFIYLGLSGRPFWHTSLLAPRFLASAFSSGPSLLIVLLLSMKRFSGFSPKTEAIEKLSLIVAYAIVVNAFFLFVEIFTVLYGDVPEDLMHLRYFYLGGPGSRFFCVSWISSLLAILSLIIFLIPSLRRRTNTLFIGALSAFFSIWLEKGIGLLVPGFVPTPVGRYATYFPTLPEIMITVGIYALGALFTSLLFKVALRNEPA